MAARTGFEPVSSGQQPEALPLDDLAMEPAAGLAPTSPAYEAGSLLLTYTGEVWSPRWDLHPRTSALQAAPLAAQARGHGGERGSRTHITRRLNGVADRPGKPISGYSPWRKERDSNPRGAWAHPFSKRAPAADRDDPSVEFWRRVMELNHHDLARPGFRDRLGTLPATLRGTCGWNRTTVIPV